MFSSIRKRITFANIAATLALVLAMSGGAYAASKYLITSTKQISPKVLKALKGKAGPAGLTGPAGPEGKPGSTGPAGKDGLPGKDGKEGLPGKDGKNGAEGSPWTAGGTLPSGKTEYGSWNDFGNAENGKHVAESISFTLPLETAPEGELVYAKKTGTNCTGSSAAPTAPPGFLCVYDAYEEEEAGTPTTHVKFLNFFNTEVQSGVGLGVGKEGTLLHLETTEIGKGGFPFTVAWGTWAVTAK